MLFIKTTCEETAEELKKLGYSLLQEKNGTYLFENDIKKAEFSHLKDVHVDNKMFI